MRTLSVVLLISATLVAGSHASQPSTLHQATDPDHEPSYAALAQQLVPQQFNTALSLLLTLNASSRPDGVKPLRINLLYARELLDIFSYTYPNASATGNSLQQDSAAGRTADAALPEPDPASNKHRPKHRDMYLAIRDDLNHGYEVLGGFQDLAHSLVAYNETDVENLRAICLQWQERFLSHVLEQPYAHFLASPDPQRLYERPLSKLSKLFWGFKGAHPSLALSGTANMALLASSQMLEATEQLPAVLAMQGIYDEPAHTQFHLYRKLIRSLLSVLQASPDVLEAVHTADPAPLHPNMERTQALHLWLSVRTWLLRLWRDWRSGALAADQHSTTGAADSRSGTSQGAEVGVQDGGVRSRLGRALRLVAWRRAAEYGGLGDSLRSGGSSSRGGSSRESSSFGEGSSDAGDASLGPRGSSSTDAAASGAAAAAELDTEAAAPQDWLQRLATQQLPSVGSVCPQYPNFAKTLDKVFHDMGQVNNWIVSYLFYRDRGEDGPAEESRQKVLEVWGQVKGWMIDQDLPAQLGCVSQALIARWHLEGLLTQS